MLVRRPFLLLMCLGFVLGVGFVHHEPSIQIAKHLLTQLLQVQPVHAASAPAFALAPDVERDPFTGMPKPFPIPPPLGTPTGQAFYIDCQNGNDGNRGTSPATAWRTLSKVQEFRKRPGQQFLLKKGCVFDGELIIKSGHDGTRTNPIVISSYGNASTPPILYKITLQYSDYIIIENLILDHRKDRGTPLRIKGAVGGVYRHLEIRNATLACVNMTSGAHDTRFEHVHVHHCLAGSMTQQVDAHGLSITHSKRVLIRAANIHHVSGDAIQADPDRGGIRNKHSDFIRVEDSKLWTGPLAEDFNAGWRQGDIPGENGIDTKIQQGGWKQLRFRQYWSIVRTEIWGYTNTNFIPVPAALNIKEAVVVELEDVYVHDSFVAFRLRGARGGAWVTMKNTKVEACHTAIRAEDKLQHLHVYNSYFGDQIATMIKNTDGKRKRDMSTWVFQKNVFKGNKPAFITDPSNTVVP